MFVLFEIRQTEAALPGHTAGEYRLVVVGERMPREEEVWQKKIKEECQ